VAPRGPFPGPASLELAREDPLTRGVYEPFLESSAQRFARLRWVQQGVLPAYLLYVLVVLVLGFAWAALRTWVAA
jgi:hypothetical protein